MPVPQIPAVLATLSQRRPVFHSEADFQHAIAWQMQLADPAAQIFLEKQVAVDGPRVHLDLLVRGTDYELAIELKYKTRAVKWTHDDEVFSLRDQSAQDIGRYDFIKDIQRLEKYVEAHSGSVGIAILLTNDHTYWINTKRTDTNDTEFRLHEGRIIYGGVTWGAKASSGTKRNREADIKLHGTYKLLWNDYSTNGSGQADTFRYALLRVPSDMP